MPPTNFIDDWLHDGAILSTARGNVLIGWGKPYRSDTSNPIASLPQFYFPFYFLDDSAPWHTYPFHAEIPVSQLIELLVKKKPALPVTPQWVGAQKEPFINAFNDLQHRFSKGILKKGVPYVLQTSDASMPIERKIFTLISVLNYVTRSSAYAYGFWSESEGMVGATPESLFVRSGSSIIETMACAGTAHAGRSLDEFIKDPKELYEHRLVIDDISASLVKFGSTTAGRTQPVPFGKLHHLVTPIKLQLEKPFCFDSFVHALHPTAALGAFPRLPGMEWLKSYNRVIERGRFGAPAGYLDNENERAACYVAIRNVQWNDFGMKLFAGCGVVPDSQCEAEWNEIHGKLQAIREALSL